MGYFKEQEIEQMGHGLDLDDDLVCEASDGEFEPDLYSMSFFDNFKFADFKQYGSNNLPQTH